MKNLSIYGTTPFDLFERILSNDEFAASRFRSPSVDIRDSDEGYVVEAELPGVSEKDIKLELKNGILSLTAGTAASDETRKDSARYIRRERVEAIFSRSFELPEDIDPERIEAKFRDGLLTVVLPRKPETAPRVVPVRAA